MPQKSESEPGRASVGEALIAGCFAGGVSQLIGFPFDTLKVRTQLGSRAPTAPPALMKGWSGPVLTAGVVQALNLGVYDWTRRVVGGADRDADCPLPVVFLGGSVGGVAISPFSTIVQRVKILQQTAGDGVVATVRRAAAEGGLRTLWKGYGINFAMELNRGFYMLFFAVAKRSFGGDERDLAPWKRSLAGSAAGVGSWILVYPADVVKTIVQAQQPGKPAEGAVAVAVKLVRGGGVLRLYRGLGFNLLRAGPVAAVTLPLFDLTLGWLRAAQ